jgi:catechol 2,3-dioxygenase-like lactoylglutathione lyase family enzyme
MTADRQHGTMTGLDHIGVGVTDLDRSLAFYGRIGFTEVAFDHTGPLPGLDRVAGRSGVEARTVLLRSANASPLGPAAIKLVQTLDEAPAPMPEGQAWGELGICEVCLHVKDQREAYRRMVDDVGAESLMEPDESLVPPLDTRCDMSYVADPDGGKVEMIDWADLQEGWPAEPGFQGVNHVAFGVRDIERSRAFYRELGFTGQLFETNGRLESMDQWFAPRTPPSQRMMLLTSPYGGGLEPVQHTPPSPDMRGAWGHVGPFEFAIGSRNLEVAVEHLRSVGAELLCEPQTVEVGAGGVWRYAYFTDPDNLFVSVAEVRA